VKIHHGTRIRPKIVRNPGAPALSWSCVKLLVPLSLALLLPALPVPAPGAPEPAPRPRLSDRLNQQFRTTLPEFKPAPARLDRAADPAPDPEVIELPEVVVREPRATRTTPDDWLTRGERAAQSRRRYLASLNGPDTLLNGWSVPLLTPSVGARAAAQEEARRRRATEDDLQHLARAVHAIDPAAAAALRRETFNATTGLPPGR